MLADTWHINFGKKKALPKLALAATASSSECSEQEPLDGDYQVAASACSINEVDDYQIRPPPFQQKPKQILHDSVSDRRHLIH